MKPFAQPLKRLLEVVFPSTIHGKLLCCTVLHSKTLDLINTPTIIIIVTRTFEFTASVQRTFLVSVGYINHMVGVNRNMSQTSFLKLVPLGEGRVGCWLRIMDM